ncbi:hypothetical protein [Nocardia sp. NBC_01329]|uniref:hypothetical protein n=1 Tax=Nocardia sp. NBC_01329 TaxID=2903594 RepID=UPI002E122274|nr:hypothetical protein OG405_27670 [Nocardia sp. NBC_01329]
MREEGHCVHRESAPMPSRAPRSCGWHGFRIPGSSVPPRGISVRADIRGIPLTPEEQRHADALNQALAKLPSYEGPLVRHAGLDPQELERYVPGKPVTEHGFPYSTLKPDGINPQFVSSQNTEFQIVSKTGKPVGQYATRPDEVMFPSGTGFMVHDKIVLPNGRVIIQMTEI